MEMWQVEQVHRHPPCGTFDWEWKDNPEAYVADIHECPGCKRREVLAETVARDYPHGGAEGWEIRLYRELPEGVTIGD